MQTEPLKARLHTKLCIHLIENYLGAHVGSRGYNDEHNRKPLCGSEWGLRNRCED